MPARLPKVLLTDVVRSTHKGDSHGGVYLIDLETDEVRKVIDWNDSDIDWDGRGGGRGLRGITFWNDLIVMAASDEIFLFDRDFKRVGSHRNPYLGLCHEIWLEGDRLWLTSTLYDAILELDLVTGRFVSGFCIRINLPPVAPGAPLPPMRFDQIIFRRFDPSEPGGPVRADTTHINNITRRDGVCYVSGVRLPVLVAVGEQGRPQPYARIPVWTHNAQPWRDGVIYNSTGEDKVCFASREGQVRSGVEVLKRDPATLTNTGLSRDVARANFGRGLVPWSGDPERPGLLIGGSSPSTVSVYDMDAGVRVKSITFGNDVRNAPHGLALWPFD